MRGVDDLTPGAFAELFTGYPSAFGTGNGGWIHRPPTLDDFSSHLAGDSSYGGVGIGPLLQDGTCHFAAIDLDRPDFDLARNLMKLLPGTSWLERSRSGNAHVLVFFSEPIEAWVPRGIMREALAAYGERSVEVYPKADRLLPGMYGNYLNLPCYGTERKILCCRIQIESDTWIFDDGVRGSITTEVFVESALKTRNDPAKWRKRAEWLGIPSPEAKAKDTTRREFGTSPSLHMCAQYVLERRDENPVIAGHRASVYFALSKQLANWSEIDDSEALDMLALVNDSSPDPIDIREMERIFRNAKRGEFTSTGCDDPLFQPYAHPDCPIVKGAR
jgi:hypothetical protein